VKSRNGSISTAASSETWNTLAPSIVRAMKGTAMIVTWLPSIDTVAADQIFTKSRCRHSDGLAMPAMTILSSRGMLSAARAIGH
jgi:hypothetical protein